MNQLAAVIASHAPALVALAGRPGSLEAIDRCSGQPKIVVALRAPVRLHEAAGLSQADVSSVELHAGQASVAG
jgi:hypothetical protein